MRTFSQNPNGFMTRGDPNHLSECNTRPSTVLVHNPVRAGAFAEFDRVDDTELESELLFRDRPDPTPYSLHHDKLVQAIAERVTRVTYLCDLLARETNADILRELPNQVFTRDSLITLPWVPDGFFCSRLKPEQRRVESDLMKVAVEGLGLHEIATLPKDVFLEGGDVIPFACDGKRCLFIGYGTRSSLDAIDYLQDAFLPEFADEIIAIRLAPWRMNLDGGFVPVTEDLVVCDTQCVMEAHLISSSSRTKIDVLDMLRDHGISIVDTTPDESVYAQSCNCFCLGHREIICYDLCPRVSDLIGAHDVQVHKIPGAELIKGRGGPRCMTRPIYLE